MLRRSLFPVSVEAWQGETVNLLGDTAGEWGEPFEVQAFAFDPGGSVELTGHYEERTVTRPTLYMPLSGPKVGHRDRVTVAGQAYEVEGRPRSFQHPDYPGFGCVAVGLKGVD